MHTYRAPFTPAIKITQEERNQLKKNCQVRVLFNQFEPKKGGFWSVLRTNTTGTVGEVRRYRDSLTERGGLGRGRLQLDAKRTFGQLRHFEFF